MKLATPLRAAVLSRDDSILLSSDIFSDFKSCNDTCIVLSAAFQRHLFAKQVTA